MGYLLFTSHLGQMFIAELRGRGDKTLQIVSIVKVDILFILFSYGLERLVAAVRRATSLLHSQIMQYNFNL